MVTTPTSTMTTKQEPCGASCATTVTKDSEVLATASKSSRKPSRISASRQASRAALRQEAQEFVSARFARLSREQRRKLSREIAKLAYLDPTAEIQVQVPHEW